MITKERIKAEIDKVQDEYLEVLYKIIKVFEHSPKTENFEYVDSSEPDKSDVKSAWSVFVNETYGCLADDPIERGDQGTYEVWEFIE
jgi:hypothetical protein